MKTIYGREGCSACEQKKAELTSQGIEYDYVDVDNLSEDELSVLVSRHGTHLPFVEEDL